MATYTTAMKTVKGTENWKHTITINYHFNNRASQLLMVIMHLKTHLDMLGVILSTSLSPSPSVVCLFPGWARLLPGSHHAFTHLHLISWWSTTPASCFKSLIHSSVVASLLFKTWCRLAPKLSGLHTCFISSCFEIWSHCLLFLQIFFSDACLCHPVCSSYDCVLSASSFSFVLKLHQ